MSSRLIDDRPIMFLPLLAKALGSCERAIVLQQIHWLLRQPNSGMWDDEGLHWVWGTYEEWCNDYFPMWSPHTLRKHIQKLEAMDVLIAAQLKAREHDRTKYYRINYAHEILGAPMRPDAVDSMRPDDDISNRPDGIASINRTKTSSKTTQRKEERPPRAQRRNYRDYPDDDDPEQRRRYRLDPDK